MPKSRMRPWLVCSTALAAALVQVSASDAACCYFSAKNADILQPAQKAFLTWDPVEKVETFTVQPKFEGSALDFGMVIPTPSQPKLHEMPRDFFKHLAIYSIMKKREFPHSKLLPVTVQALDLAQGARTLSSSSSSGPTWATDSLCRPGSAGSGTMVVDLQELAQRMLADYDARTPGQFFCEPVDLTTAHAYALQAEIGRLREQRGEKVIGYKVGCTSRPIQVQLGVKEPIFGRLFDTECHPSGVHLSSARYANLAVEGEMAVRLSKDLPSEPLSAEECREAIAEVFPVIELHHYVIPGAWPPGQWLIASNGMHGGIRARGSGDALLSFGELRGKPQPPNQRGRGRGRGGCRVAHVPHRIPTLVSRPTCAVWTSALQGPGDPDWFAHEFVSCRPRQPHRRRSAALGSELGRD